MTIPPEQVEYHAMSLVDPSGRLFRWNGGLYRAISPKIAPVYERLFETGTIAQLISDKLLIETERTQMRMDGCAMVLRHRVLPFVSYPYEWSAGMLKAAALKTLDLEIEISKHGMTLQDAHPWNVLFEGTEPWFVDFGSIVPLPESWSSTRNWPTYEMFCQFFLRPLILMTEGYDHIARWLLFDGELGVGGRDLAALTGHKHRTVAARRKVKAIAQGAVPQGMQRWVKHRLEGHRHQLAQTMDRISGSPFSAQRLRREVEGIAVESAPTVVKQGAAARAGWEEMIDAFVAQERPGSMLHIGPFARAGGSASARSGVHTAAIFPRAEAAQAVFEEARGKGSDLLPIIMDFRRPWPAYGIGDCFAAPAPQRLGCEAVVAFDVPCRMAMRYGVPFEKTAASLAEFSRRWVLTTYVPVDDPALPRGMGVPPWYGPEAFMEALGRHFASVRKTGSATHPLYLCEKPRQALRTESREVRDHA